MQIVLVDPSRTVRRIVGELIQQGGNEICPLSNGDEALTYIKNNPEVRALITCAELETMSGIELCRQARALVGSRRPLYILLMSSSDEQDRLVQALDNGADDFICKPPIAEELRARLRTAERVTTMQNELFRYATTDFLTGLLNRRVFFDRAGEACERAKTGNAVTATIFDLDHFKQINDTHGHGVGDAVLRSVAAEAALLEGLVGRLGGEEFGIIVDAPVSDAFEIAESFRRAIGELKIHADNKVVEVTCSLGLAEWEDGDSVDSLLRRADMALYEAKRAGRDRVIAADTYSISKGHENWQGVSRQSTRRGKQ
ncbi:MAG: diguanylate cyclase [Pseudolabrys sp.]|nr:diguanylate cyclase [Pseudolabrys sp.]MDP2294446.1 diguanylate cyclase [Pseudolabrys sp.]